MTPAELEAIRARDAAIVFPQIPGQIAIDRHDLLMEVDRLTAAFNAQNSIRVSRLDMEVYYIGERDERNRILAAVEALPTTEASWGSVLVITRAAVIAIVEETT